MTQYNPNNDNEALIESIGYFLGDEEMTREEILNIAENDFKLIEICQHIVDLGREAYYVIRNN